MGTFTIIQVQEEKIFNLIPSDDGCNIELTPIGDTNNWECVDDPISTPNDDTDYNHNDTANLKYDLYKLPDHTTETGTINFIHVFARAKSHETPQDESGIYKIILTDNACSDIYKSDDIDLTTSYATYGKVWATNPRTAVAWIWADIDNLQIGLECNSPQVQIPATLTIRPTGAGSVTQLDVSPAMPNYEAVRDVVADDEGSYVQRYGNGGGLYDLYNMTDHTTETGTITGITIFARIRTHYEEGMVRTVLKTGGSTYYGDVNYGIVGTWIMISMTYDENPKTSSAWTWGDIDNLETGIYLYDTSHPLVPYRCTQLYVVVDYIPTLNPEIRTTQCFAKVNYTPPDVECTLNKPEEVSVDHARNIKMLNFWSGNREVYDLSRSSKGMIFTGSEYQSDTCNKACPCERITCIREMGKRGYTITVSGLRSLFNGEYKIRSFGWTHISERPEHYEWILELEDAS